MIAPHVRGVGFVTHWPCAEHPAEIWYEHSIDVEPQSAFEVQPPIPLPVDDVELADDDALLEEVVAVAVVEPVVEVEAAFVVPADVATVVPLVESAVVCPEV